MNFAVSVDGQEGAAPRWTFRLPQLARLDDEGEGASGAVVRSTNLHPDVNEGTGPRPVS